VDIFYFQNFNIIRLLVFCILFYCISVRAGQLPAAASVLRLVTSSANKVMFSSLFVCLFVSNFAQKYPNGFA